MALLLNFYHCFMTSNVIFVTTFIPITTVSIITTVNVNCKILFLYIELGHFFIFSLCHYSQYCLYNNSCPNYLTLLFS